MHEALRALLQCYRNLPASTKAAPKAIVPTGFSQDRHNSEPKARASEEKAASGAEGKLAKVIDHANEPIID